MNIDAGLIANYFYSVPEEVYTAMERIYASHLNHKPYNGIYKDAYEVTKYINEIPPNVFEAMKRVLEVKE